MASLTTTGTEPLLDHWLTVTGPGGKVRRVAVGTCGFSYTEWIDGGFYPPGTRAADMLGLYAGRFPVVELNYTWYQMARAEALARMLAKAPDHLLFAAKLTRTMTHDRDRQWREQLELYREGITPLAGRLLAILVQLPPGFDRTIANRRYLAGLLDGLRGLPLAVEFRHRSWAVDSVFAELERRRISLVCVDAPPLPDLFPCLDVVTNPGLVYVRFHGRNSAGWRTGNLQKKFLYDYDDRELAVWCEDFLHPMLARGERGVLFFNNHVRGHAAGNALALQRILAERMGA